MIKLRRAIFLLTTAALLYGIGILVFSLFLPHRNVRGAWPENYAGVYYGMLNARFFLEGGPETDSYVGIFSLQGESPRMWAWRSPKRISYRQLEFQWSASVWSAYWEGERHDGKGVIDLVALEYQMDGERGKLTPALMNEWLFRLDNVRDERIEIVFEFILDAANGRLPPPRHHGYTLDEPFPRLIMHGTSGLHRPPWFWVASFIWLAVVTAGGLLAYRRSWSPTNRRMQPD